MRKFFWTLLIVLMSARGVMAAELGASIRLETQKTGANPLPILVLIKTSTASVENSLNFVVDNEWAVSGSVPTSVSGLPSGVTPLPSIGAGVGSGQNINFTIGDLTSGVEYGFYIDSGIGVNPGTNNHTWRVSTNTDAAQVNVPVVNSDQVTVTGRVGALASDFQIGIAADKVADLSVDEEVTYEITYGSYLLTSTKPLVITGSWTRGTVLGSPTPSVDIVDYVVGSGTTGFGGVTPVIDLLHNKITWTITSFPANTLGQTVSFKLRVNHSYTGQSRVRFDTEAVLSGANVVTTNSSVTNYYLPAPIPTATTTLAPTIPVPTDTPTSNPTTSTATNTNTATSTPSPIPTPKVKVQINKIEIVKITDSEVGVVVDSNTQVSELKILYGTTLVSLKKSLTSINNLKTDLLNLDGLLPDTIYYFKIIVTDKFGNILASDVYTFRTASVNSGPFVDNQSLVVSIDNNVVLDASEEKNEVNSVIMVPKQNYAFRINLKKSELVKNVRVLVRSSQVLGIISVYGAEPNSATVDLDEIVSGGFVGHLVSPQQVGYYDVVLRIEDKNGGISEDKIGILRVVNYLKVKDKKTNPIENAKVVLNKYDPGKRIFKLMSSQSSGLVNPNYTEVDGSLRVSLPTGRYRVDVSAIGFEDAQQEFSLGLGSSEVMPEIILKSKPVSLTILGTYFASVGSDVGVFISKNINNLTDSNRFFNLIGLLILVSTLVLVWNLGNGPIIDYWLSLENKNKFNTWGKVIDQESKKLISGATVYLLDGRLNKVLSKSTTNFWGRFQMDLSDTKKKYRITVTKEGYEGTLFEEISAEGLEMGNLVLKMENIITPIESIEIKINKLLLRAGKSIALGWLLMLLFLELLFWYRLGWNQAGVWVVLSWLNIIGWSKL